MDYNKVFYEKSDEDLQDILKGHHQMNIEAKSALVKILRERQLSIDKGLEEQLNAEINGEYRKINDFEYAKNLGLKVVSQKERLIVTRSFEFKIAAIVGLVIGFITSLILINSFTIWKEIYENGVDIGSLINAIITFLIGVLGISLFVKCLSRLLNNYAFKIDKITNHITIKNPPNFSYQKFEVLSENLAYENDGHDVSIILNHNGQRIPLIKTSGSQIHKETVKKIYEKLQ